MQKIQASGYLPRTVASSAEYAPENSVWPGSPLAKSLVPRLITTTCGLGSKPQTGVGDVPSVLSYTLASTFDWLLPLSRYAPQPESAMMLESASSARAAIA